MKHIFRVAITFAMSFLLYGCSSDKQSAGEVSNKPRNQPITVGEIAYDKGNPYGYRIYLEENGNLVPFLVLTSKYNNDYCLILREHLLDDYIIYNSPGEYGSYYAGSNIDDFLNQKYYYRFSEEVQRLIVTSKIEITTKNSIDTHTNETENIVRNIFLLSANEVNASLSRAALKEGETLSFFNKVEHRIATFDNLESSSWLLRTPALRDGNTIVGVAEDGSIGMGGINTIAGNGEGAVRPAFCISADVPITSSDITNEESVFCIK